MPYDYLIKAFLTDSRCAVYEDGSIRNIRGRRYFGYLNNTGYRVVKYKNTPLLVSRLVCANFHGFQDDMEVNHKDGNPDNNKPENLEWVTSGENKKHRFRTLKALPVRGHSKISMETANLIRRERTEGMTMPALAKKYGLAKSTISYIINRRSWNKVCLGDHHAPS